jgi:hypothetical protein
MNTVYFLLLFILFVQTVRSLLHMLLPDGGVNSIAGLDIENDNIIAIFGQWGTTQLVSAISYWILILYDESYTTLIFGLLALEYFLRIVQGWSKPLQKTKAPPGETLSYVILPLSIICMYWSYYIHGSWLP